MPEPPSLRYACNMRHPMNARSPRTGTVARQPAIYTRDVAGRHPRIPVDSGVRGGADIFKALALGATTVGLGRPYAYGLAVAGKADVGEVIANLAVDFELTMALAGCADGAAIHGGAARLMAGD